MPDVRSLVPRDKHDHERASAAIAAGYPAVESILFELLEWLQDMNWPVAQDLAPFLAGIGSPLIPHIRRIFETNDEMWKYWIIGAIFQYSEEVAEVFRDELARIAYSPTDRELEEGLDEQALRSLEQYGWAK